MTVDELKRSQAFTTRNPRSGSFSLAITPRKEPWSLFRRPTDLSASYDSSETDNITCLVRQRVYSDWLPLHMNGGAYGAYLHTDIGHYDPMTTHHGL